MKRTSAVLGIVLALSAAEAGAQALRETSQSAGAAPVRTGKERLGEKASDEQRVNDCRVPPEKRGTRRRPTECARK